MKGDGDYHLVLAGHHNVRSLASNDNESVTLKLHTFSDEVQTSDLVLLVNPVSFFGSQPI